MVKVTEYNFGNDAIRWQISKSTNVIFTWLIFAKIRPVVMAVTYTHTYIHTQRETDKAMAIGEIEDLSNN